MRDPTGRDAQHRSHTHTHTLTRTEWLTPMCVCVCVRVYDVAWRRHHTTPPIQPQTDRQPKLLIDSKHERDEQGLHGSVNS
mmetsp:Transcript_41724/g.104118  ORF Transcript_41724/g.104118 Transcript_41724/m.104118 type:complete len:81 (+) Transcript_41724:290-532(+)